MATPKVVNGQIVGPDGVGVRGVVRITLSASAFVNAGEEVLAGTLVIQTDQDGTWHTSLWANADLTPANTTYAVSEQIVGGIGGSTSYKITVPNTAGPFSAAAIAT
jgi:hypothetical protein